MTCRAPLRVVVVLAILLGAGGVSTASTQDHGQAPPAAAGAQPAHPEQAAGEDHAEDEAHAEGIWPTIARLFNFAILVGVLVYFLRAPVTSYLASRGEQIRQDLVTAAQMRQSAAAQLEEMQRRMQALPAELEALKARGAEDVRAERARIAHAAAAERERLLAQTSREIDMRLRLARRELTDYAAQLAVNVAQERLARTITPEDQLRLVDRYTSQLREAR
jgi:F-type H+-transporting ATPase subunit b